jgi:hypothetical protein
MKKSSFYVKEQELIEVVSSLFDNNSSVAIIGGHYFLLYESKSDSLKPSVYEDFEDEGNKTFAMLRAKYFPLKTFKISLNLVIHFNLANIISKCIMVVNDEAFLKRDFRGEKHFEIVSERGHELRKKYFAKNENLPNSFIDALKTVKLAINDVFFNFTNSVAADSYMPQNSIFLSERKLCKKFRKTSKKIFNFEHVFSTTTEDDNEYDNLTIREDAVNQYCLIEDGLCNCGGKAFQLYYDAIKNGFSNIIFFVPNECIESVNKGADILIKSNIFTESKISIINISNIGQDSENLTNLESVRINFFQT